MSTWSVKTQRAPSRHGRDARVYGHTTTVMHDIVYTPTPPSHPLHLLLRCLSPPRSLHIGVCILLFSERDACCTKIPTELPEAFPQPARQHLLHRFEGCVQKGLDFQRKRCREPVSCVDIQLATSLSFIFQVCRCDILLLLL